MRVLCVIVETELETDGPFRWMEGVEATCSRCQHTTKSFGAGAASRRRCLVLLREECPEGESNFYIELGG